MMILLLNILGENEKFMGFEFEKGKKSSPIVVVVAR
jgi:hypothetical protein